MRDYRASRLVYNGTNRVEAQKALQAIVDLFWRESGLAHSIGVDWTGADSVKRLWEGGTPNIGSRRRQNAEKMAASLRVVIFSALIDSYVQNSLRANAVRSRAELESEKWRAAVAALPDPRVIEIFKAAVLDASGDADSVPFLVEPPGARAAMIEAAHRLRVAGQKPWHQFKEIAQEVRDVLARCMDELDRVHPGRSAEISEDARLFYTYYMEGVPKKSMYSRKAGSDPNDDRRTARRRIVRIERLLGGYDLAQPPPIPLTPPSTLEDSLAN